MTAKVIIRCTRGGYKFVVLKNKNGETIVFADDNVRYGYHSYLFGQYEKESGLDAECLGGGYIKFDGEKKVIRIGGSSESFGREPHRKETVSALKEAYPEFDVRMGRF